MEWVETTGKSVDEAVDSALDQLGVDKSDAEIEVLGEPKTGLFGRVKSDARVRVRVKPTAPPSKDAANNNRRRRSSGSNDRPKAARGNKQTGNKSGGNRPSADTNVDEDSEAKSENATARKPQAQQRKRNAGPKPEASQSEGANSVADEEVPLEQQAEVASTFLTGLLGSVNQTVDIEFSIDEEDEIIEVDVDGENLGHLIGPKGATLQALQELTRTVVQRQTGARNGRVIVDVGGYREKRREALERFSRQIAEEVLSSGSQKVLEPMNPADRKVVHDLIGTIDGVSTSSEGEEPRRRVVVRASSSN